MKELPDGEYVREFAVLEKDKDGFVKMLMGIVECGFDMDIIELFGHPMQPSEKHVVIQVCCDARTRLAIDQVFHEATASLN